MQTVRRWYVAVEDKQGKTTSVYVDATQLKFESGCAIFIKDGTVICAYAADVWAKVVLSDTKGVNE